MESTPKPWKVEYAKSSRSTCKTCKNSILKGNLRIAKMVHSRQFDGLMPMWNHAECILKQRGQFHTIDDLEGFDVLQFEDQDKIRKYLNDLTGCFATNTYASPTIDGLDESTIEKSKSSRATCKSCNQKIAKGELEGSLVPINILGFLKTLVAVNFGGFPMQSEAQEDLEEMQHIPLALLGTVKHIKRAKAELEYLQAENDELKATQEIAKAKLKKEFASVPLLPVHDRELELFSEDQQPLMEVTYQACQYKQMQELA